MKNIISSPTNSKIKSVVRLRQKKSKDASLTIVEGHKEVSMALRVGAKLTDVFICEENLRGTEILKLIKNPIFVSAEVFHKMAYGQRNEGILAVCEISAKALTEKPPINGLYVILEEIEKPGNLGAMLRTCDAAGVDGVIVCDEKAWIYSPNVVRASLGAVFTVPIYTAKKEEAIAYYKENNIQVIATSPQGSKNYTKCDLKKGAAFVLGSEHDGLSDFWLTQADEQIVIPMKGEADSLNVSHSMAVLLYETLRQRQ